MNREEAKHSILKTITCNKPKLENAYLIWLYGSEMRIVGQIMFHTNLFEGVDPAKRKEKKSNSIL